MAGGVDNNCKTANAVTDFPEPDSPTMATISPLFTVREIFCNADIVESLLIKSIERFSILSKVLMNNKEDRLWLIYDKNKQVSYTSELNSSIVVVKKLKPKMSYRQTIIDKLFQRINADL